MHAENEEVIIQQVRRCKDSGMKIRVAGAGHSSSPLVTTDELLISLDLLKGLVSHNAEEGTATFKAGTTVHEANHILQREGLALFNTGDVDVQMLAGAIATGTHGTGKNLQNLSAMLVGARVIDGHGVVHEFNDNQDSERMKALRVSLGLMGILTAITVKVVPLFKLERREICTSVEDCLDNFDRLGNEYRNVDFYWYPRSDEVKIRLLDKPGKIPPQFAFPAQLKKTEKGWVGDILPRKRDLKFDEMEYALPAHSGIECFKQVRQRILERHRKEVAWRVLVRTVAADDNYVSPHFGRNTISISLHHNAGLPFDSYFSDVEPLFREFDGRPHWGKKHYLKGSDLKKLYPEWNTFNNERNKLDPQNTFMNPYLEKILNAE
jgi:FAD/FMN-containing dehydrogenase